MPQRFGLYEDLSVQENLDLYADMHGVTAAERKERYPRLLEMTDLGRFTDRLAGRLSGGMKQKLGLACTLVRSPELLLLDEPTVGVDPLSRRELWSIILQLVHEQGLSVLVSTSYLDEAERCDRCVVLQARKGAGAGATGRSEPAGQRPDVSGSAAGRADGAQSSSPVARRPGDHRRRARRRAGPAGEGFDGSGGPGKSRRPAGGEGRTRAVTSKTGSWCSCTGSPLAGAASPAR